LQVAGCFSVQRQIAFILKRKKSVNNRRFLFIYLFFTPHCVGHYTVLYVQRAGYLSTCNFLVVGFDVVVVVPAKSVDSLSMVECDRNSDASLEK
jgi:hypothetical protein